MTQQDIDAQIAEAWNAHYAGRNEAAIDQFRRILEQDPEHIDANWGLGLSYRNASQNDEARAVFEKVQLLLTAQIESEAATGLGRYFMLDRMVKQQLAYLTQFTTNE